MPTPYAGSSDLIPVNPMGQLQRPRLPASGMNDPNRNLDLMNNVIDPAMEPDRGMSAMSPRDPYMASLPPRQPQAAPGGPVTTLQPSRTAPFSRADAQALAALDPRALEEAKGVAALPESTPAKMTGSFGGKSFEMQPSARVDRNALAKLYAAAQERKTQERADAVRGQEQAGQQAVVRIPGEQLNEREKMRLEAEERITGKKLEADAPARAADIAAKQAQTAAATGAEQRAAAQAARQPSPAQEALEQRYAALEANPIKTAQVLSQMEELQKQILAGRGVAPDQAASAARGAGGPAPDIGTVAAEIMADPGMVKIIEQAKASKPGFFTGNEGRTTGAAARQLAERAIRARGVARGMTPEDIQQFITSILGAPSAPSGASAGGMATRAAQVAGGGALPIGLIGSFVR